MKTLAKLSLILSFALLMGCTTTTTKNVPYTTTADRAYECALGAARDGGLQVATSDAKAGIFQVITGGGFAGGMQISFAVDKQARAVNVIATNHGGGMPGAGNPEKIVADFQAAFSKRCR
jgi:hypothetical protein